MNFGSVSQINLNMYGGWLLKRIRVQFFSSVIFFLSFPILNLFFQLILKKRF